jgi:hypothetical protein
MPNRLAISGDVFPWAASVRQAVCLGLKGDSSSSSGTRVPQGFPSAPAANGTLHAGARERTANSRPCGSTFPRREGRASKSVLSYGPEAVRDQPPFAAASNAVVSNLRPLNGAAL